MNNENLMAEERQFEADVYWFATHAGHAPKAYPWIDARSLAWLGGHQAYECPTPKGRDEHGCKEYERFLEDCAQAERDAIVAREARWRMEIAERMAGIFRARRSEEE